MSGCLSRMGGTDQFPYREHTDWAIGILGGDIFGGGL